MERRRKRKGRFADATHGGENHLQADGDVPAAKRPKKKGVAAGVGGGTGGEAPAKVAVPRALAKCGVCRRRKSECKGGPAACPDKRFAKPDVPKANLKVDAGSVLMLYDIGRASRWRAVQPC